MPHAKTFAITVLAAALAIMVPVLPARSADTQPWKSPSNALIIDAYEMNVIDWDKMLSDKRIAAFINKASDGLPESYSCANGHRGDTVRHCRTMWRKYAVSRELYQTRRMLAKAKGLLWGAYHLARPANPIDQANHFLDFAEPSTDELMVIDIEDINEAEFMSLADAEIFVRHIKTRTGRYPVLYTNHTTAKTIAADRDIYPVLSRLPLWYARYKPSVRGVFPMGNWETYAIWQFSTMHNCTRRACPYRVPGTLADIDVNVAAMDKTALAKAWPFGNLLPKRPKPEDTAPDTLMVLGNDRGRPDQIVTGAIPMALAGMIPVPVLSDRWLHPEVKGFLHVALPSMPDRQPRISSPVGLQRTVTIPAAANGQTVTALNYQDF